MSRIGNKPVTIPAGVEVTLEKDTVKVKGPKGELKMNFDPRFASFKKEGDVVTVSRLGEAKEMKARHGLYRNLLQNMIEGLVTGFKKTMEIQGVGYRAALKGKVLEMSLGFSHPIKFEIPAGITIEFQKDNASIFTVSGIDKQLVGQVSADIRGFKKPEPYKGKGIRYTDERVVRKAGKSAAK